MNENVLAKNFNIYSLLKFVMPTILMMVFTGLYTLLDTIFAAQLVSTDALAAINIVCPIVNLTVGFGTMLATGGNAIISRNMGENKSQLARENFTFIILAGAVIGFFISATILIWTDEIIYILGASEEIYVYCKDYLIILAFFIPANMLQTLFANLFVTAGKPALGSFLVIGAGIANIALDYIFIVGFDMGIQGAALGTGIGYLVPTIVGLLYFSKSSGILGFCLPKWRFHTLILSCLNGFSEMVNQLAMGITTFLFNITMMRLLGEDGVAAITIIIYSQFMLSTLYIGFSMGVAPIIGYHYGSGDKEKQKRVFGICVRFIVISSIVVFLSAFIGGGWIVQLFADVYSNVYEITSKGFQIFSWSFLFCGVNIFVSAAFTALSNGKVSAMLSFLRTFIFLTAFILFLPKIFGVNGVWFAVPLAEGIAFLISVSSFITLVNNIEEM